MGRVWREGQKKDVFIYRLLTTGGRCARWVGVPSMWRMPGMVSFGTGYLWNWFPLYTGCLCAACPLACTRC